MTAARPAFQIALAFALVLFCDAALAQEQIAAGMNTLHTAIIVVVRAAAALLILGILLGWMDGRPNWAVAIVLVGAIMGAIASRTIADRITSIV